MSYDLASAKDRLGIPQEDTSQDDAITIAMNGALAICEQFCMRNFFYAGDKAVWYYATQSRFHVDRYPIDEIVTITDPNGNPTDYKLNKQGGWLDFQGPRYFEELTVEYRGGFLNADLPADLELALWSTFDNTWAVQSGEGLTGSSGEVQSITVPDVGTVRFSGATTSGTAFAPYGHIPSDAVAILWQYRRAYA